MRWARWSAGVMGGAAVIALVVVGYRVTRDPTPATAANAAPAEIPEELASASPSQPLEPPPATATASVAAPPREAPKAPPAYVSHSADPCRGVREPSAPEGFETVSALGITVASQPGEPALQEPTAFAHLVAGLLEEAALLTGTARRDRLTVIRYTSSAEFRKLTKAPSWSDGTYDGAVHVPADRYGDFGVQLRTLRHELMHAQLHAGVGCTPFWLNEGAAMQFGREPPKREWIRILREHRLVDPDALEAGVFEELSTADLDVAYGQSLAMVLLMADRRGVTALAEAIHEIDRAATKPGRQGLWARLHPNLGRREIADSLAQRIFKVPVGPELDSMFTAAVCCWNETSIRELGCRSAPLQPGKRFWVDRTREPRAYCQTD